MGIKLKRGDIVVCALSGDYGKPRPAVVIQADLFNPTHASITICPVTTHLVDAPLFRLSLVPTKQNGLKQASQVMVDKIMTLPCEKIRKKIGALTSVQESDVNQALKTWLALDW
jgi:mRNA interferase MazF